MIWKSICSRIVGLIFGALESSTRNVLFQLSSSRREVTVCNSGYAASLGTSFEKRESTSSTTMSWQSRRCKPPASLPCGIEVWTGVSSRPSLGEPEHFADLIDQKGRRIRRARSTLPHGRKAGRRFSAGRDGATVETRCGMRPAQIEHAGDLARNGQRNTRSSSSGMKRPLHREIGSRTAARDHRGYEFETAHFGSFGLAGQSSVVIRSSFMPSPKLFMPPGNLFIAAVTIGGMSFRAAIRTGRSNLAT